MAMALKVDPPSPPQSTGPDARRNFILQQGLCEPEAATCPRLFSALLFQPRVVGPWVIVATILQSPILFFALGAVLWWSALLPRLNPFDAVYNATLGKARGITLGPAPAPRRFSQGMAGSFALAIGVCLVEGWRPAAYVLEGFFLFAVAALVLGGFCLGSFIYHVLVGKAAFAKRTLPWAGGT